MQVYKFFTCHLHTCYLPLLMYTSAMQWAVEVEGLMKVYEQPQGWRRVARAVPVTAVSNIHFTIPPGELFGLLGPNGAGKTTLVKMLCTLIRPTAGSARVCGHDLTQSGAIRAVVGLVVSDERSFFWRLSARRNLDFFAALHGLHGRSAQQRIQQVLADVDLLDVADRRFSAFSSGMRQRLAIARALLHRPQILFLDEPSRSLDPTATQRLHDLIRRLMAQREMTVFLITHDLVEAEKLCDRVALMHNGRIQTIGHPETLREQLRPQRVYQLTVGEVKTDLLQHLQAYLDVSAEPLPGQQTLLTFSAAEGDGRVTAVLRHLHRQQCPVHQITTTMPTLEDVFAHFTGN
ncbi:MAG: ABC transporter ATP-binding protein [Ardenticatenaceae bacterium]|nr:ABC transporter ATP-binding protein [Ardenticatenaceae bacterium]MCB8991498.1 ABC transporter ATP-binding protein [Ardenticatenaceae bacterium]MCB9004000.1 ABC transporter ATP-binding protein [Ardenticatenaceae bacterium]